MAEFDEIAIGNAIAQGKTSAEVRAMGYKEIAALAMVSVSLDDSSPAKFIYQGLRNAVVGQLARTEQRDKTDGIANEIETAMLTAGHSVRVTVESTKRIIVEPSG